MPLFCCGFWFFQFISTYTHIYLPSSTHGHYLAVFWIPGSRFGSFRSTFNLHFSPFFRNKIFALGHLLKCYSVFDSGSWNLQYFLPGLKVSFPRHFQQKRKRCRFLVFEILENAWIWSLESVWKLVRAASQLKRWTVTRKTVKTKSHTAKAKRTSSGMQWPAPSIQGKSKEIPISVKPKLREPQGIGLPYHPQTI